MEEGGDFSLHRKDSVDSGAILRHNQSEKKKCDVRDVTKWGITLAKCAITIFIIVKVFDSVSSVNNGAIDAFDDAKQAFEGFTQTCQEAIKQCMKCIPK